MSRNPYDDRKKREAARQREQSARGQDIGPIGFVADPARRLACAGDFKLYCEAYHAPTFHLGWSRDHLKVLRQVEDAVFRGELFATAMPRGSGKTSIAEVAVEFAALNGYHPFVVLIGSDEESAGERLASIKTELEVNDELAADYPEVCLAVRALEGIANRCKGQRYGDGRTRIEWTARSIVLPSLRPEGWPGRDDHRPFLRDDGSSLASGAVIQVAGITGAIRGLKHKRADGRTIRPTFVVPDDPQTDQSARSPSQCEARERILAGAILGLAGPGKKIAGVMPCTVIRKGDMADSILDREKHPEWHGTRTKLLYRFPSNMSPWEEYARIRAACMKAERPTDDATAFYREHRPEMDEGAVAAWPERRNDDELSALQHAMNLLFDRGPRAFHAEFQNDPMPEEESRPDLLTPDQIAAKVNRVPRLAVPTACSHVTAFVDVHASVLYYAVAAWEGDFTGFVVDYGAFPSQPEPYFTLRDARRTLAQAFPGMGPEGQLYAGLQALCQAILGREHPRDDGAAMRVGKCLIDANWGPQTELVYKFCRESPFSAILTPSHGRGIGASSLPMREWRRHPGDSAGFGWHLSLATGSKSLRKAQFDANLYKSFLHARLATAMGDKGCLSLFGERPEAHRMLAEHLTAEHPVTTRREGSSRAVDEWKWNINRPDNHLLDCLVGCCVGASMLGVALPEASAAPKPKARRPSFTELQARARARGNP